MFRLIFRLIFLALILLGIGVVFAPNLASTKWGKSVVLKIYKAITGNTLAIESAHLSWSKGQQIEGVSFKNRTGDVAFEGKKISTDATLWQIAFYHDLGKLEAWAPHLEVKTTLPQKIVWLQGGLLPLIGVAAPTPVFFGHILAYQGTAQFISPGFDPISLNDIQLDASIFNHQLKLKSSGQTQQGNVQGKFQVEGSYSSLSNFEGVVTVSDFPVRSIDQLVALSEPKLQGAVVGAMGEAINIDLKVKNQPKALDLFCVATSPSFSAQIETQTKENLVTLSKPAIVRFEIPQKLISSWAQDALKAQLKIDQLELPLDHKEQFSCQMTLKTDRLLLRWRDLDPLTVFISTNDFSQRDFTLKIDSSQLQLNSELYFPKEWNLMRWKGQALFPSNTRVDFSAQTLANVTATIQGDSWQGAVVGGYDLQANRLFLTQPADFTYHLNQLPPPLPPLLDNPALVHIKFLPFKTLEGPIQVEVDAESLMVKRTAIGPLKLEAVGEINSQKGNFNLTTPIGGGSLIAKGSFLGKDRVSAALTIHQVPTAFVDTILQSQFSPIIGHAISGSLDGSTDQKMVNLQLTSDQGSLTAALKQNGNALVLSKPAKLALNLTPQGYNALETWLNQNAPFKLNETVPLSLTVSMLQWPLNGHEILYQGELAIKNLNFSTEDGNTTTQLAQINLKLNHPSLPLYQFELKGGDGLVTSGKADLEQGSLQLNAKLDQFPTDVFDVFLHAAGKTTLSMVTLFGPQINLTANSTLNQWSGPIAFQLSSPQIRASLDGALTKGVLSLKDRLHIQMSLSHELSDAILKEINPLSLTSFAAHDPITLEIAPEGFSYPLLPTNDSKINISQGHLELGKIDCRNEGNLNVTLGLLKLSQFNANQDLQLWFAPLDFKVENGMMACERTEILVADRYQICSWGDINLVDHEVDMILGLTASCLSKAFGLKNLPENYVLQIPMRGPFDNVKINTSKATTKIGALLLWQQKSAAGSIGGGPAGAIVGGFLNKLGPLPDSDSKAPPPKRPFPWEQPSEKKRKLSEGRKYIDPNEQPLKQVLKLLR